MSRLNNGNEYVDKRSIRIEKPTNAQSSDQGAAGAAPRRVGLFFRGLLLFSWVLAVLSFGIVALLMRDFVFP